MKKLIIVTILGMCLSIHAMEKEQQAAYNAISEKHSLSKAIQIYQTIEFAKTIERYRDELHTLDKEKTSGLWNLQKYEDFKDLLDTFMLIAISTIPTELHNLAKTMLDRENLEEFILFLQPQQL